MIDNQFFKLNLVSLRIKFAMLMCNDLMQV